jgi:hypothetical protein
MSAATITEVGPDDVDDLPSLFLAHLDDCGVPGDRDEARDVRRDRIAAGESLVLCGRTVAGLRAGLHG